MMTRCHESNFHGLLVEDHPIVLESLQFMLQSFGWDVSMAQSGERALQIFREQHNSLDFVLVDQMMPGMQGCDVILAMREIDPRVPCILTSGTDLGTRKQAVAMADGFIMKPYRFDDLRKMCVSVISKHVASLRRSA